MFSALYGFFLAAMCSIFLLLSAVALLITYPIQKSRRFVHEITRVMVNIFFWVPPFWHRKIIGLENMNKKSSYVVICNHSSMADIPTLYSIPLNFRWVSKREAFKIPFVGRFLMVHGDICIDRGRGSEAMVQLLSDGQLWLSRGASVAVFPEGTRSKNGVLRNFRAGAFTLAREANVEILPVVITGSATMLKPNFMFNWRNRVTIKVLPPISRERIATTDINLLMVEVRESMIEALESI